MLSPMASYKLSTLSRHHSTSRSRGMSPFTVHHSQSFTESLFRLPVMPGFLHAFDDHSTFDLCKRECGMALTLGRWGDFSKINIAEGDMGGELDPHGATGNGNPVGGNVTSNITGEDVHYEEWMK